MVTTLDQLDPNDVWRDLTPQQVAQFRHDLKGWAPSYDALVDILSKRELNARVLVGCEVAFPLELNFRYAQAAPTMHSSMRVAVRHCVDLIFADRNVKYLGLFDYILDMNEDIVRTTSELGGSHISISGAPVFLFPRGSAGLHQLDLYRSHNYSLCVGLRDQSLESVTDFFAYVFDQESLLYASSAGRA